MAPIPPPQPLPRIVIYHQTHHTDEVPVSVLPLISALATHLPHLTVIVGAIHLNDPPGAIHLNDHPPSHPRNHTLWAELRVLQASGARVLGMLGGAAKGSFTRLDLDEATFEAYYCPLRDLIRTRGLDGLDLDVEEEMSLGGIIRLIDRLKADFGPGFLITLAPVAAALQGRRRFPGSGLLLGLPLPHRLLRARDRTLKFAGIGNLSGFDYEALEVMRGPSIAWYNTQFYCGWGDMSNTRGYDVIMARGYQASKVVVGLVTNPGNGAGFVDMGLVREVLLTLRQRYPGFGGVGAWEVSYLPWEGCKTHC